jgi:hypothetical protein
MEASSVRVNIAEESVTIVDLTVKSPEFVMFISSTVEELRTQAVRDVIAVGSAAMQRLQTAIDVEFVERRMAQLSERFGHSLDLLKERIIEEVYRRFSPTESGSYVKAIGDLVCSVRQELVQRNSDVRDMLDPERNTSAVGRIELLIQRLSDELGGMINPDLPGSFAARLNEQIVNLFGCNGHPGLVLELMNQLLQPVLREIQDLRQKVEARRLVEEIVDSSTLKGRPFEELIGDRLSLLAQPFGDDIDYVGGGKDGSKAGDFVIRVKGANKTIVVEARNRKQLSLPAIKSELDREMKERQANFALYISSAIEMLPQHVGDFQVYDDKIITTIDNLHIAYRLCRLFAVSDVCEAEIDLPALRTFLRKILESVHSLQKVRTKATQVQRLGDEIREDTSEAEAKITQLVREAELVLASKATSLASP